jgi:bacterioferritin-associated ferredoxin
MILIYPSNLTNQLRAAMIVCHCQAVTVEAIRAAVREGRSDLEALARCLGVATGCGGCRDYAQMLVEYLAAEADHDPAA